MAITKATALANFASGITGIGSVGIGTTDPRLDLEINGDVRLSDTSPRIEFHDANAADNTACTGGFEVYDQNGSRGIFVGATEGSNQINFGVAGVERVRITEQGLGIGVSGSNHALTIREGSSGNKFILLQKSSGETLFTINEDGDNRIILNAAHASGALKVETNSFERLHIDSSGVGIGSDSPQVKVDIQGGEVYYHSGTSFNLGAKLTYSNGNSSGIIDSYSNHILEFRQNNTEIMNFMTNKEVYIPGTGLTYALRIGVTNASTYPSGERGLLCYGGASNHFMYFVARNVADGTPCITNEISGTRYFEIEADGDMYNYNGTYGQISDARLKENIVDASSQWDDIKALRVRNFNFISNPDAPQIGFVAQEVEEVSPGLVRTNIDRDSEDNVLETTTKVVKTSVLQIKAVKALQEAMERIEILESRLNNAGIATT